MTTFKMGSGILQPDQLATMRGVLDEVASAPWFSQKPEARNAFAQYLLENFPDGSYDPVAHRPIVEATARKFFARDLD